MAEHQPPGPELDAQIALALGWNQVGDEWYCDGKRKKLKPFSTNFRSMMQLTNMVKPMLIEFPDDYSCRWDELLVEGAESRAHAGALMFLQAIEIINSNSDAEEGGEQALVIPKKPSRLRRFLAKIAYPFKKLIRRA